MVYVHIRKQVMRRSVTVGAVLLRLLSGFNKGIKGFGGKK
jgi:hypothetical protein